LLAGHALDYLLLFPGDERAHVLAHTGHAYLSRAPLLLGAFVAAAVLGALLAGGLSTFEHPSPTRGASWRYLALIQSSAFVALELLERSLSGAELGDLLSVMPLGLVTQIVIACVSAALLALLFRAGARIASAIRRDAPRPTRVVRLWHPQPSPLRGSDVRARCRARAPPSAFSF
jgi:hypothetical protein